MLLSINYIRTDIGAKDFQFIYQLVEKECVTRFVITASSLSNVQEQQIIITNGILEFIYSYYKATKECPFVNIKFLYVNGLLQYDDEIIRETQFYKAHTKVIDKIIRPIALVPQQEFPSFTYNTITGFGSSATSSTARWTSNTYITGTATNSIRYTFNIG